MHGPKNEYGLQVAAVGNEGRELTTYRIQQFALATVMDFSCVFLLRPLSETG